MDNFSTVVSSMTLIDRHLKKCHEKLFFTEKPPLALSNLDSIVHQSDENLFAVVLLCLHFKTKREPKRAGMQIKISSRSISEKMKKKKC